MLSPLKLISVSVVSCFSFAACSEAVSDPPIMTTTGGGSGGTAAIGGMSAGGTAAAGAPAGGMAAGGMAAGGMAAGGANTGTPACAAIMAPAGSVLPAPKLVIAEIALGGAVEHIVVHNNSAEAIALAGYSLCSNYIWYPAISKLTATAMIAPGEFLSLEIEAGFMTAGAKPEGGELLLFEGTGLPKDAVEGEDIHDYVCWGTGNTGRKDTVGVKKRYPGACAPAMTAGALRRIPGTSGEDAASYDATVTPSTCAK